MFSFFKKAKKDSESNGSSKEKKSKEKVLFKDLGILSTGVGKEMCKNKTLETGSASQSGNISVIPGGRSEFELLQNENDLPEVQSDDLIAKTSKTVNAANERNETNLIETIPDLCNFLSNSVEDMEGRQSVNNNATKQIPAPITSYANALRNDTQQRRISVKPCGHGTVAIAPKIPIKREQHITPSSSPELSSGAKPKYRRVHSDELPLSNFKKGAKNKRGDDESFSSTIKSVMQLRVELPNLNKVLSNDAQKLVNGTQNEPEKYVIKIIICIIHGWCT